MARKHISQMSPLESVYIHGWLRSGKRTFTAATDHFYHRASERTFTFAEAVEAVRKGKVVEVHNDKAPSVRALVRDLKGTCVVVDLTASVIVSVYYNSPDDKHDTLNWNLYRWTQDIVALVKSL